MGRDQLDNNSRVRDVVAKLLLVALPPDLRAAAPSLVARVAEHPLVAPLIHKRWGQLSHGDGNRVKREVGIVARAVIAGAADAYTASRDYLH